jgi:hypothetical protein
LGEKRILLCKRTCSKNGQQEGIKSPFQHSD